MTLLTAEELRPYRDNELLSNDNDWGYGQMPIDKIVSSGYNDTDKYNFFGTVSAADDDWNPQTIVAHCDYLFVFPLR